MRSSHLILLVLAICSFGIGSTEFVIAGLLEILAKDFQVSIPAAGWIMTSYALTVTIGAPIVTALTISWKRKYVLMGLLALFILGNLVVAIATTFPVLIVGRILSALCHGAFFGIGAVVASHVVEPKKKSMAIALMFSGLTLATVLGVPFGTLLGEYAGWRAPFCVICAIGAIGWIGIALFIPLNLQIPVAHLAQEIQSLLHPDILLSLLITALGFGGLFACFSYITPLLLHISLFSQSEIAYLLLLFGCGLMIGNLLGGKAADQSLPITLYTTLFLLAFALFLFVFACQEKWSATLMIFLLGVIGYSTVPALQMHVVHRAKKAPTLSSSANIAAFNLGISLSIFLGGLGIHFGWGYRSPSWIGAILTLLSLLAALFTNKKYKID